jgi:F-type H+-transporting ATPase subunit alpha
MGVSLFAVENDFMDDIALDKIGNFEEAMHDYMNGEQSALMDKIGSEGNYNDDIESGLKDAIAKFKENGTW